MKIAWIARSDLAQKEGYSRIGWKFPVLLERAGAEMLDLRDFGWDWRIVCGLPESWYVGGNGVAEDLCLHTMTELQELPRDWVPVLNRVGLVWVPSAWCRHVFQQSGVERPIMVSGYGVDPEEYGYTERERDGDEPFTFLAMDYSMFGRKRMSLVMKAFCKLKCDILPGANLRLILKTTLEYGRPNKWEEGDWVLDFHGGRSGPVKMNHKGQLVRGASIVSGSLSTYEIGRLFGMADCFVHPTGGEGFGLPALEAMMTGLPVITTFATGQMEYLREGVALRIPSTPAEQDGDYPWRTLDEEAMLEHMAWCVEHRDEAAELGSRASTYVLENWTWDRAGEKAVALLEHHLNERR